MRTFLVVLVISALGYQAGGAEDIDARASVKDTIEELIKELKEDIPEIINIPDQTITLFQTNDIFAALSLTNNNLKGLKEFDIDISYVANILPNGFALNLTSLDVHLDVISVLEFLNSSSLVIETDGYINVGLTDLQVQGDIEFKLIPLSLAIRSLHYSIGNIKFDIGGVLNQGFSEFVSTLLTDVVAPVLNSLEPEAAPYIEGVINDAIAAAIANSTETMETNKLETRNAEEYAAGALKITYDSLFNKAG